MQEAIQRWLALRHPAASLIETTELQGGISSAMSAFSFSNSGRTHDRVLRLPSDWRLAENPQCIEEEALVLGHLERRAVPTPAVIDKDLTGEIFGRPALILEFVPGSITLNPEDRSGFITTWAQTLASIHLVGDPDQLPFLSTSSWFERYTMADVPAADYKRFGDLIPLAMTHSKRRQVNADVLLHADLWPGNLVWSGADVSGVIDWEEARRGDPLLDVSLCRLEAIWLFGDGAENAFLEAYLSKNAINLQHLPIWDLLIALRAAELDVNTPWSSAYEQFDRPDITTQTMLTARDRFIDKALAELDH